MFATWFKKKFTETIRTQHDLIKSSHVYLWAMAIYTVKGLALNNNKIIYCCIYVCLVTEYREDYLMSNSV